MIKVNTANPEKESDPNRAGGDSEGNVSLQKLSRTGKMAALHRAQTRDTTVYGK